MTSTLRFYPQLTQTRRVSPGVPPCPTPTLGGILSQEMGPPSPRGPRAVAVRVGEATACAVFVVTETWESLTRSPTEAGAGLGSEAPGEPRATGIHTHLLHLPTHTWKKSQAHLEATQLLSSCPPVPEFSLELHPGPGNPCNLGSPTPLRGLPATQSWLPPPGADLTSATCQWQVPREQELGLQGPCLQECGMWLWIGPPEEAEPTGGNPGGLSHGPSPAHHCPGAGRGHSPPGRRALVASVLIQAACLSLQTTAFCAALLWMNLACVCRFLRGPWGLPWPCSSSNPSPHYLLRRTCAVPPGHSLSLPSLGVE
ncbi:uncharacterized protein LOC117085056 [Trachypithecus francoisi]|uniref:uncharacterized protein LOC117085056 n=1 Tax=Trachypithecus francoisi TaxID=54180 RepID=UPI00141BAA47|nr:uncharacterized protein LOC117085056 [Trachypithecus francoisi]